MNKFKFVSLVLLFLLASCLSQTPTLPAESPLLEESEEYLFGNITASFDSDAWTAVWDTTETLYPGELSLQPKIMAADADWQALQTYYESSLSSQDGWESETRLSGQPGISQVFAFKNGDYVFAVVGLDAAYAEGGFIPVNVITNVPE